MSSIRAQAKIICAILVITLTVVAVGLVARANTDIAHMAEGAQETQESGSTPYTDGKDYAEVAIGGKLGKVRLADGWSVTEECKDMVLKGNAEERKTIENCVSYNGGEARELRVKLVSPRVLFLNDADPSKPAQVESQVELTCEEDSTVKTAKIEELLNPYSRAGYELKGWRLSDGTEIAYGKGEGEYDVGDYYFLTNYDLLEAVMRVYVLWTPKTDTKVTVNTYKETTDGEYESTPSKSKTITGTSDATVSREDLEIDIDEGFVFDKIESEQQNEDDSYVVRADGSTVIKVYLKRKACVLKLVAGEYAGAEPGGTLPEPIDTFYGAKVALPQETDFSNYGYTFAGWTDGATDAYGSMKVYGSIAYVVDQIEDEIELSIVFEPNNNTEYMLTEYFDGEQKTSVLAGRTGTTVDVSKRTALGYKRVSHEGEILSGVITGFETDAEDKVIGGERLHLIMYYESNKYTVSFDTDNIKDIGNLKYKEDYELPVAPQKEGYNFEGYFINGVRYAPGDKIKMSANDVRVHVVWRAVATTEASETGVLVEVAEEEKLSDGAIAGIAVGSVVGTAGMAVGGYFLYKYLDRKGIICKLKNEIKAKSQRKKDEEEP